MLFLKLGLLTCAFYVVLTALVEAGILALVHYQGGVGVFFTAKHWFWSMGLRLGIVFGALWIASFLAAWSIVYHGLKSAFPFFAN